MMETVRQIQKKLTKDKKKKSKSLGLFLVFRECVAIKINHKRYHFGQRYFDAWIGKKGRKALPLVLGFSHIYLEKKYENIRENVRLPYELLSIRIDDTAIEFSFVKSDDRRKAPEKQTKKEDNNIAASLAEMPPFKYENSSECKENKKSSDL